MLTLVLVSLTATAQRVIDKLDRGLIAIKTTSGVYVNWRIQSNEYFDVKYNLYRNGTKIAENLNVSNYTDAAGTVSNTYTVAAVVRGKEQAQCAAVKPWSQNYLEIIPKHDSSLASTYVPNDACCVDVDGDGVVEILMKYNNVEEGNASYPKAGNNGEYTLLECLKLDGTVLWWVNCGPNMGDFQNNEQNIVGYDWDMDGKGEVIMRLCEGASVHMADGTVYTIGADGKNGTSWTNYRQPKSGGVEWFTFYGNEYLYYCEGATGKPYQCIDYPCARLEPGETDLNNAWGDGYGHRSNKHFFGAPYLDGRKPSMFIGRGIYTRHKFVALDVDPETHALTQRWRWYNNTNGPWKGQGYHNYAIADVDMDGRDEIIWGSMVIDDNGKGLSTSGLGHGDAQHHGDLDPYTWGLEGFFCNEEQPANNYRDLTTAKIYHRYAASGDDGRAIAGNFSNDMPGAMGFSAHENAISCVTGNVEGKLSKDGVGMNFRCYWDGDLLEETYNGGDNTVGSITKYKNTQRWELTGSLTNNSTKATPCYMGDVLGDWREEFIVRTPNNRIRIYSTTEPTKWRNYSLWYDHQYRNGMVWEPCGYNQPPHTSYFLGELEGITVAPPSLTMTGRKEIANGATISNNDEEIIMCETGDMTVAVADGATPYIYIDNAPSWVQGYAPQETSMANDPSKITYKYYTHTLTGGAFAGDMRLVKQGEGTLVLPKVTQTYTGNTDVWNGQLSFDGTMQSSRVWLNRHTALNSDGGVFKTIQADYNATIRPGGVEEKASTITADSLILNFGSKVEIDVYSDGLKSDVLNARVLKIEKKTWPNGGGPAYDAPVFVFKAHVAAGAEAIADGKYFLGNIDIIDGNLSDLVIGGMPNQKVTLEYNEGEKKLYANILNFVGKDLVWTGSENSNWNLDKDANFVGGEGSAEKFVTGSVVTFNDNAKNFNVIIEGNPSPKEIIFDNTKAYTISGDSIVGGASIVKNGGGNVSIKNINRTGNVTLNAGIFEVAKLANSIGDDFGSLGDKSKSITLNNNARFRVTSTSTSEQRILVSGENTTLDVPSGVTLTQKASISRTGTSATLTKKGAGTLVYPTTQTLNKIILAEGTLQASESNSVNIMPTTVELQGGKFYDTNSEGSYSTSPFNFVVPAGKTSEIHSDPRSNYTGRLTGAGTLTFFYSGVRCYLQGDWSAFEGELIFKSEKRGSYDPGSDYWRNNKGLPYATLNVPNGYRFNNAGNAVKVKAFKSNSSASGTLEGSGTYTVGEGATSDITNYHYITSPLVINMDEGRNFIISNATAGRISGNTTVKSGNLRVASSSTADTPATGEHLITVTDKGKLFGSYSYVYAVTAQNGGVYSITSNSGTATTARAGGNINIYEGSAIEFYISSSTNSKLTAAAALNLKTGAIVRVKLADGFTPAEGKTYTLWNANTFSANESSVVFDLPELPAGLKWDTSALLDKTGVLKVVKDEADAIANIPADRQLVADVYAVDGRMLGRITTTKASLNADIKRCAMVKGTYVVKFVAGTNTDNITVNVR